jgi:hypothetical protein
VSDAYRGDSWEKRVARVWYWEIVQQELGPRFSTGTHLVLASQDGGDVATLLAMGVRPDNIVACDTRGDALEAAKARHSADVHWFHGDVADAAARVGRRAASVFLDFCGHPTESKLATTRLVVDACLGDGTILGLEFARGREGPAMFAKMRAARDRVMDHKGSGLRLVGLDDCDRVVRVWLQGDLLCVSEHDVAAETDSLADGRSAYVFEQLFAHGLKTRCLTAKVGQCRYFGHKTPMEIVIRRVKRAHPATAKDVFHRAWTAWCKATIARAHASGDRVQLIPSGFGRGLLALQDATGGRAHEAGAYNMTPGQLAAIRAHMSRETYGTERGLVESVTKATTFAMCDVDGLGAHLATLVARPGRVAMRVEDGLALALVEVAMGQPPLATEVA